MSDGGAGGFHELARLDGRYLSAEVAGGFTGRMLGLADGRVSRVRYTPSDLDCARDA
jgi:xylan 1,4-beta-xylosidase